MNAAIWATLIATAAGTGAWILGLSQALWPAHPMLATLILTAVTYTVVKRLWPRVGPR